MDLLLLQILRPWFLLLFIPCWAIVWVMLKNQDEQKPWLQLIEPHLLEHLLITQGQQTKTIRPAWLIGLVLSLLVLALSGPAWQKKLVQYQQLSASFFSGQFFLNSPLKIAKLRFSTNLNASICIEPLK